MAMLDEELSPEEMLAQAAEAQLGSEPPEMPDLEADEQETETGGSEGEDDGADFLALANEAFEASDRYVTASLAPEWERNLRLWQSRHPSGSKYLAPEYANRSKIFRPKTRSAMRKREAAAANAFFATSDIVLIEANDDGDQLQRAAADTMKWVMNYRLTKTIPWFLTAMGAWQDTGVFGYCVSRQGWVYEEKPDGPKVVQMQRDEIGQPMRDETGRVIFASQQPMKVVTDRPDVTLVPPENIRIDPAASWMDPVMSSPYFIVLHPMFVTDIEARMARIDPKTGAPKWKKLDRDAIRSARNEMHDTVRRTRANGRQEPVESADRPVGAYDIVWVREVFVRHDGEDYTFWTLGSQGLLCEPKPTNEVHPHLNRRPYRMGFSTLEAHQPLPTSPVGLGAELQALANQIVNDRNDNVRLALQARYFVRAGQNVDLESLRRNVPGSTTLMKNPEADVRVERAPDVTRSAYEEQDRANVDYDELVGHFSAGTVQSERSLNETVGGMNMLHSAVSSVQDFDIRVWAETWVEPVLRDLLKLEQALEDDETVLAIAGKKAQLFEQYGISFLTDEILEKELHLSVDAGFGSTDPMRRLQKFQVAAQTVGMALGPAVQQMLNAPEIIDEVFGILGYKNPRRFFNFQEGEDPQVSALKQQVQQLQQELESNLAAERMKFEAKMRELEANTTATAAELRHEREVEAARLKEKFAEHTGKMSIEFFKLMQAGAQHRADVALGARDQDIGRDQDKAKRLGDAAQRVVGERKAKEKEKADGDARAQSDARFEKLLTAFAQHAEASTKTMGDLMAAISKPRKFNLVRGADGKAAGVVQE